MAIERFLNEAAWNQLIQLIDDLGAVDLEELTERMNSIEGTVNAAVATANAASQQAQNAANTATAMGNRVTDLEEATASQGASIRTLQSVSNEHTTDIAALETFNTLSANSYTSNGVTFVFRKIGRTVIVTSFGVPTEPIPTNGYMPSLTVDAKYRPVATNIVNVMATASSAFQVNLSNDGVLQVGYAEHEITTTVRCVFSYISA